MNPDEIKYLVTETTKVAVKETLLQLGIATSTEVEIVAIQNDMAWLRKQRNAAQKISDWLLKGAITTLVSGLLYVLWEGFKIAVSK